MKTITTMTYTFGKEWGEKAEGTQMTLVHNPMMDGPIEGYEKDPRYIVKRIEIES